MSTFWTLIQSSGNNTNSISLDISELTSGMSKVYSISASGNSCYVLNANYTYPSDTVPDDVDIAVHMMVYRGKTLGINW